MQTDGTPFLQTINLGRQATDGKWLLREISLSLSAGNRWAICGPTGSGKTLLLRALALLDDCSEGTVLWNGEKISAEQIPEYRSQVIYVHQKPALIEGTVEENLRLPYQLRQHRGRKFDIDVIDRHLKRLGRDRSFLAKKSQNLSGGESQIVALLRAIQLEPAVLLLDEPTASLDSSSRDNVEQLVGSWWEADRTKRTTVWVSHDEQQILRVADCCLTLNEGRIEELDHAN